MGYCHSVYSQCTILLRIHSDIHIFTDSALSGTKQTRAALSKILVLLGTALSQKNLNLSNSYSKISLKILTVHLKLLLTKAIQKFECS